MKIDGVSKLDFGDHQFTYGGKQYRYDDIQSVRFWASETRNLGAAIGDKTTYDADLAINLRSGTNLRIKTDRNILQKLRRVDVDSLHTAKEVFSELTFSQRVSRFESEMENLGFFTYNDLRFHRNGDVFKGNRFLFNIRNPKVSKLYSPFQIDFEVGQSIIDRVKSFMSRQNASLYIARDGDCILYMLMRYFGITWIEAPVRKKDLIREPFFTNVL